MTISRLLRVLPLLLAAGCSGSSPGADDEKVRTKMASDLVECQNDRLALKEKIGELQAEIQKLKAAAAEPAPTDTAKPTETPPHRVAAKKPNEAELSPDAQMAVVQKAAAVAKRNSPRLHACYEKALKHSPDLATVSSVTVRFTVAGNGSASDVVFSKHAPPEMAKCMGKEIAHWQFPTFSGAPVQVETPVSLVAK